jgi:hypothetical protein
MNHPNRKKMLFTLQSIRDAGPCKGGWTKLLKALPPKTPLSTLISLGDVAAANDAQDAWWCVRVLDFSNVVVRRRVVSCLLLSSYRAAKNTTDNRVIECLDAVRRWCEGSDTVDLSAARSAAWSAAWSAARSAAWSAESAARSAAWSAESAARSATESARSAAWSAEKEHQRKDIIKAFKPAVIVSLR